MTRLLFLILASICCLSAPSIALGQPANARKVALVIGNSSYRSVPTLANPSSDAAAIAAPLREIGFQVELLLDADRAAMASAVERLAYYASGAEVALFFYAGHAMEAGGQNLLLPVNVSSVNATEVRRTSVNFAEISAALEGKAKTTLIFLDACRDNPLQSSVEPRGARSRSSAAQAGSRSLGGTGGLASVSSSSGMLIAFATAPGRVALDGSDSNSPFTRALVQHLKVPGLEVRQLLGEVRRAVREATAGQQVPWDNSSLEGTFYFVPATSATGRPGGSSRFDGTWTATITCPDTPSGALGWSRTFYAEVRGGRFRGEEGSPGAPNYLLFEGTLQSDGTGILYHAGVVGPSRFALGNAPTGTPFRYPFDVRLGDRSGTGIRTAGRNCTATFSRRFG